MSHPKQRWTGLAVLCLILLVISPAAVRATPAEDPVRFDEKTMSEPKAIHKVAPQYPQDAKEEGVQGRVVLDAVIDETGRVSETRIKEAADPRLAEASRDAVAQWRYEPMRDDEGEAYSILFEITIQFRLDGDKKK